MNERAKVVLMEAAGLLSLLSQGIVPPNLTQQASDLLNKIGDVLVDPDVCEDA